MQSEVADVLRKVGSKLKVTTQYVATYARLPLKKCRTAELGGHAIVILWQHHH
jgi:hypothetical protein